MRPGSTFICMDGSESSKRMSERSKRLATLRKRKQRTNAFDSKMQNMTAMRKRRSQSQRRVRK